VVAEGVERASQLEFLREQGCAAYQGYLACPPIPAAQFEGWLAKQPAQAGKPASKKQPAKEPAGKKPASKVPVARKPAAKKPGPTRK
jgi:predicted signal transduction protein with EAL and GGDEF domain